MIPLTLSMIPKEVLRIILLMGREPILGAIWFVVTLLLIECMYYCFDFVFQRLRIKHGLVTVSIVMMMLCILLGNRYNIGRITPAFRYFIFFFAGNKFYTHIAKLQDKHCVIFFIVFIISALVRFCIDTNYYVKQLILYIAGFSSIVCISHLSNVIARHERNVISKFLVYSGVHSYEIMAFHFVGFKVLSEILILLKLKENTVLYQEAAGTNGLLFAIIYWIFGGVLFSILYAFGKDKIVTSRHR